MTRLRTLAAGLLLAAAAACAPSDAYRVRTLDAGAAGVVERATVGNHLGGGLELELSRVGRDTSSAPAFALVARLTGDGAAIHPVAPLVLVLDGDTLRLARDSAEVAPVRHEGVRIESARYPATVEQLRSLAAAGEVRLRLRVGSWTEERRVAGRPLENLRRFLREQAGIGETT